MQTSEKEVWFPAKRHGWGWGPPRVWQGWAVLAVWLVLLCTGGAFLTPKHAWLFGVYIAALGIALFLICLLKGEKPRWRPGKD